MSFIKKTNDKTGLIIGLNKVIIYRAIILLIAPAVIFYFLLSGCTSIPKLNDDTILSKVNGEFITFREFREYLQTVHLQALTEKKIDSIDINRTLDKLIQWELFVQEAIRLGLDKRPEVTDALNNELMNQCRILHHKEMITDKAEITEDDAWLEFKKTLGNRIAELRGILDSLQADPNEYPADTKQYLMSLWEGAKIQVDPNFNESRVTDPNEVLVEINGGIIRYGRLKLNADNNPEEKSKALQGLIDRELIKLQMERYEPTKEKFEKSKENIIKRLRKELIKKKENEYLENLKEKAKININRSLLSAEDIDPNQNVAFVNNEPITMNEVLTGLELKDKIPQERLSIKEGKLQFLIDCILIDQDASSYGYADRPEVQKTLKDVKKNVLYGLFVNEILMPSIKIEDEKVKEYYDNHQETFNSPLLVKAEEIKVTTFEEAEKIMDDLKKGADFSFLAKKSLKKRLDGKKWLNIENMPGPISELLGKAEKEGAILGPVSWEGVYSIFLIRRLRGGHIMPFSEAKEKAYNILWQMEYNELVNKWNKDLRNSTKIVIYEKHLDAIRKYIEGTITLEGGQTESSEKDS